MTAIGKCWRRCQPPRPADPPPGRMWWHGELMPIMVVEKLCRQIIGSHDDRPRVQRDRDNGIVRRFRLSKGKSSP